MKKGFFAALVFLTVSKQALAASEGCPCLTSFPSSFRESDFYENDCVKFMGFCYPKTYGLANCAPHDKDLPPNCNVLGFPGPPNFCSQEFCWVDPKNCDQDYYESSYFPGTNMFYSYRTCGSINSFLGWFSNGVTNTFTDLVGLIEGYVLGTKKSFEQSFVEIQDLASTSDCFLDDSCSGCDTCERNTCWREDVDFSRTNTVFSPPLSSAATTEEKELLSCSSNFISSIYRRISGREYNDNERIAYQYFGHKSGAMVQWPAIPFCSNSFDARRRPWYAAAVSGPKDIVLVIDVSGSMREGDRIPLAKKASIAVLDTLTWVDYVSIITFDSDVLQVSNSVLQQATERNIANLKNWIEKHVFAQGGTNFVKPLKDAYTILSNSKDSEDRSTCSQAIMFLTDGEADLTPEEMEEIKEDDPNVVLFTYALGSSADSTALKLMACSTNGLFNDVKTEIELPARMSSYYNYFATLQEPCKIAWIPYTDAVTGTDLVSACTSIYDIGTQSTSVLGVHCTDLNLIVSPSQLRTCANNGYTNFIRAIRSEAMRCPKKSRVEERCILGQIRRAIDPSAVCPGDPVESSCTANTNIAFNKTSCQEPDENRFNEIALLDCEDNFVECYSTDADESRGISTAIYAGIGTVVAVLFASCICMCYAKMSSSHSSASSNSPHARTPQSQIPFAQAQPAQQFTEGNAPIAEATLVRL